MIFRLLCRRRTQPQCSQNNSYQLCQQQKDGTGRRNKHCSVTDSGSENLNDEVGFFFTRGKDRRISGFASRAQSPGPFQRLTPSSFPTTPSLSTRYNGRWYRDAAFEFDESAKTCHVTPAAKALAATCGTIAAHILTNEDKREKVMRRVATMGNKLGLFNFSNNEELESAASLSSPPGHTAQAAQPTSAPIAKNSGPLNAANSTPRLHYSQILRSEPFLTAWSQSVAAPDPSLQLSRTPDLLPRRADEGTLNSNDRKPLKRKDSGTVLDEATTAIAEAKATSAEAVVQDVQSDVHISQKAPTSAPPKPTAKEIVRELNAVTEQYDAESVNILGLKALKSAKSKKAPASAAPIEYFEYAAGRDHASAAYNAALCHEQGIGGVRKVDMVRAIVLYRQAAVAGHEIAQYNLAILLLRRSAEVSGMRRIEKDAKEAVKWLNESAAQGFEPARKALSVMKACGVDGVVDPESVVNVSQEVQMLVRLIDSQNKGQFEEYAKAAEKGSSLAAFNAGVVCENAGDFVGAVKWYKMATSSANEEIKRDANYNLGILLQGTAPSRAKSHFKIAARLGDDEARECLLEMEKGRIKLTEFEA